MGCGWGIDGADLEEEKEVPPDLYRSLVLNSLAYTNLHCS